MFDIGFLELVLVAVIALLVLGPERLPKAARAAGAFVGKAKKMLSQFTQELDKQIKAEELREKIEKEGKNIGLPEIQKTIDNAMKQAKEFEHLTETEILPPDTKPLSDQPEIESKIADNSTTGNAAENHPEARQNPTDKAS